MRKILIICSNITVALQIRNYYLTKKNSISYKILIQDNFYTNDIIQIFNIIKNKEIIKFNFKKRPIYFNLIKFYNFFKIKNFNKKLHQKFQKSNLFKKIKNEDYEEIWFSNDNLSKIYLYKNETKKIYFSHGANDFLIEKKYLDKLTFVKRSIDDFINNYFLYVFKISNNNSKIISIFNNFLIKNKFKNNIKKFREDFIKNFNFKKKKYFQKKKINLINISIPYAFYQQKYKKKLIYDYVDFFIHEILNKIIKQKKILYVLKFKENIPINLQKKIIKKFNNYFKDYNLVLFSNNKTGTKSLEKFVTFYNVENYYSNFSSSLFLFKIFRPNVKLYNFSKIIMDYWKNKQNLLFENHQQNQSNYLRVIKFYNKIWINL